MVLQYIIIYNIGWIIRNLYSHQRSCRLCSRWNLKLRRSWRWVLRYAIKRGSPCFGCVKIFRVPETTDGLRSPPSSLGFCQFHWVFESALACGVLIVLLSFLMMWAWCRRMELPLCARKVVIFCLFWVHIFMRRDDSTLNHTHISSAGMIPA